MPIFVKSLAWFRPHKREQFLCPSRGLTTELMADAGGAVRRKAQIRFRLQGVSSPGSTILIARTRCPSAAGKIASRFRFCFVFFLTIIRQRVLAKNPVGPSHSFIDL
ncbi:hypothetical protein RRG08_019880 [Elysia crispata]|uniref:Uncharacterized protein n=1 Tax=Elysia crispata TaxID=231223 RepID=A0AAE0Z8A3_9GAST|nr:hypothetical protein RRG08_019880 [Elysia crispata]